MWYLCQIKRLEDIESGVSQEGRDWKRQDIILEYGETDDKGNQVLRTNGQPLTNLVKITMFGQMIERVAELAVNAGNWVWANIRISTRSITTSKGGRYVTNEIFLVEMREAQKVSNG